MIETNKFGKAIKELGVDGYTGVPCSYLKNFINFAYNSGTYTNAPNEGEALAFASGTFVGNKTTAVLLQNSGLGNMINPLSSLNEPFKIPVLIFISMRRDQPGESQHRLMGETTEKLIETLGFSSLTLSKETENAISDIEFALTEMNERQEPFFILVEKNTFDTVDLIPNETKESSAIDEAFITKNATTKKTRFEVLKNIKSRFNDSIIIATTGKTGRELFTVGDADSNLYMVGSMGLASTFALGVASATTRKVVVIDGDGAAVMRLSAMPMIANKHSKNLIHIILDNGVHDSTGGQQTISNIIDFPEFAFMLGYDTFIDNGELKMKLPHNHPTLIYIKTLPGSMADLPRPDKEPDMKLRSLKQVL